MWADLTDAEQRAVDLKVEEVVDGDLVDTLVSWQLARDLRDKDLTAKWDARVDDVLDELTPLELRRAVTLLLQANEEYQRQLRAARRVPSVVTIR